MNKINRVVPKDYALYLSLVEERKTIKTSPIDISQRKRSNRNYNSGESAMRHNSFDASMKFVIETKVINIHDFKFKLHCPEYHEAPFFRFDSDGPAHRNNDPEIPLEQQQVLTPHFHKFNSKGIEIAYKTQALEDPGQALYLQEIDTCLMHFCGEGNLRYKEDEFPVVDLHGNTLGIIFMEDDPLKSVQF